MSGGDDDERDERRQETEFIFSATRSSFSFEGFELDMPSLLVTIELLQRGAKATHDMHKG